MKQKNLINLSSPTTTIGKIERTNFVPIYDNPNQLWFEKGKVNAMIRYAKGKSGVYYIKEDGRLVYVGHSTYDLYTVILRHFQKGQFSRISNYQEDLESGKHKYTVKIVFLPSEEALRMESLLINRLRPRDNKYSLFTKVNEATAKERYKALDKKIDKATLIEYEDVPF